MVKDAPRPMTGTDPESTHAERPAERLFREFVARVDADPDRMESELVAAHPEHEAELRELVGEWRLVQELASDPDGDVAEADRRAWVERLRRLRAGPAATRYRPRGEIARGGMGVIHAVFDEELRRDLAMKVLRSRDPDGDPADSRPVRDVARFVEEAQVTAQLNHPGVVPVHELGVNERGEVFFTMELVDGDDLHHVIRRMRAGEGGVTRAAVLSTLLRVCEAVAYAHDRGVTHRDLKPANIMVGRFGRTYVMDWGLARVDHQQEPRTPSGIIDSDRRPASECLTPLTTLDGEVLGTPVYMSPEQAFGRLGEVDAQSDVYAMGAILYEVLAGQPPYLDIDPDPTHRDVLDRLRAGPPTALARVARVAPEELVAICEKAMSRERSGRYATMNELAADLRAYLEGRVVGAHRTDLWTELVKTVRRHRGVSLTAGLAFVALTAVTVIAVSRIQAGHRNTVYERDNMRRFADVKRLAELVDEVDELWPATSARLDDYDRWVGQAVELLSRGPLHRSYLDELRARGVRGEVPAALTTRRDALITGRERCQRMNHAHGPCARSGMSAAEHLASFDEKLDRLAAEAELARRYAFDDTELAWKHDTVSGLLVGFLRLTASDPHGATLAAIQRRRDWARGVEQRTLRDVAGEWADAIATIAASDAYDGLRVEPQLGLIPLGVDPDSGLMEFWHPQTGEAPGRDERGRLSISGATGLVFVLVPGGDYLVGVQRDDELGEHYDPMAKDDEGPPRLVVLSPFFISKYEMTQGQWARLTGDRPSHWLKADARRFGDSHPVDSITWHQAVEVLGRVGFALPTESQWEVAARGGSAGAWPFDPEEASRHANLADRALQRVIPRTSTDFEDFDDGFSTPSPVGSFAANRFGLHDVIGNVCEWCLDEYAHRPSDGPLREGDGLSMVIHTRRPGVGVTRGGDLVRPLSTSRIAQRVAAPRDHAYEMRGLRPIAAVRRDAR